ncbi:MAG: hypothetical protein IJ347_04335 [Faecalibacterium sp.]|nr:hypothetical protein [Faecalibacterium sp.]
MQISYHKHYSQYLGREMEFKVYGHTGTPVLALPCRGGRFYDWEDHGMIAAAAQLIEAGKLQLFCADSTDWESFTAEGAPRARAEKAEAWFCYLTGELYPRILAMNGCKKGAVLTAGTDLGAAHALRLRLRRPELFAGALCLSGDYEGSRYFGDVADDLVVRCGCAELVRCGCAAPADKVILCAGRGPWEGDALPSTEAMAAVLGSTAEVWSEEVSHDWYWWARQFELLVQRLLK